MPQCQLLVFGFRKVIKEIFSELDETKSHGPIFLDTTMETKEESEEGTGGPTPCGGAGPLPGVPSHGVGPSGLHRRCPFAHKQLFARKPQGPDQNSTKSFVAAVIVNPRLGEF